MSTLNILFTSMDSVGHVNCCLGVAELLKARGHKITFTLKKAWEPSIKKHGFDFIELVLKEEEKQEAPAKTCQKSQSSEKTIESISTDSNSPSCCARKVSPPEEKKTVESCCQKETNPSGGCCRKIQKSAIEEKGCCKVVEKVEDSSCCRKKQSEESGDKVGDEKKKSDTIDGPNKFLVNFVRKNIESYRRTPMENVKRPHDPESEKMFMDFYRQMHALNEPIDEVIKKIKPDVVIIDFMSKLPCLMKSDVPWVQIWSPNPMALYGKALPPWSTGFPTDSPKELWEEYRGYAKSKSKKTDELNVQFLEKHGLKPTPEDCENFFLFESPYLNLYPYPEVLDYHDIAPRPKLWFRMDSSVREPDEKTPFVLPEKLANKPGKLIYFSLGSMGSVDVELMRNVIRVLTKTPYRVIVSKGPLHDQIELPDNMWGDKYVNQLAILPHVDLVITHGGNNTLTESLYFGKPLIVLPLFIDQLDNAQRVQEKKLGIRLNTYRFKDEELLEAIEKSLNDKDLHKRLAEVSQQLKTSKTSQQVCDLVEKLAKTKKCPLE
ncbi:uncharacterized protein LOC141855408 [Brevipalpus obovatus]|uniref:uncharacterized protein LOC141855408 n=1 Tax=Brevipalpus obovatus TaxID=246614 RepID=UPI003D9E7020